VNMVMSLLRLVNVLAKRCVISFLRRNFLCGVSEVLLSFLH
jgi:hypothetical protein